MKIAGLSIGLYLYIKSPLQSLCSETVKALIEKYSSLTFFSLKERASSIDDAHVYSALPFQETYPVVLLPFLSNPIIYLE